MREEQSNSDLMPRYYGAFCFGGLMDHEDYMREALKLAEKGMGFASPNPMVGAVIVLNGEIIGRGWHKQYGGLHAEREAIEDCDQKDIDTYGADMYVTLEPCCHKGKQPPCTQAIIDNGIKRVFVGSPDPNPLVAGKGVQYLREHGVEVIEGVLQKECDALNEIFFHFITKKTPFITMKYAMTVDGKIACHNGASKWITGEEARNFVQRERLRHSAIMVGVGTVIADDPMLNCRLENGRDPVRIIMDTHLRTPLDSKIVRTAFEIPTIIVCCLDEFDIPSHKERVELYKAQGCRILNTYDDYYNAFTIDIEWMLKQLADANIDSILLEGGAALNWSMLSGGYVNKTEAFIAPKIVGGNSSKSPVGGIGTDSPDEAFFLKDPVIHRFGEDIMIESRVDYVHWDNRRGRVDNKFKKIRR